MNEVKQKIKPFSSLLKETWEIFKVDWSRFAKMIGLGILGIVPMIIVVVLFTVNSFLFKESGAIYGIISIILGLISIAAVVCAIYVGVVSKIGTFNLLKNRNGKIYEMFKAGRQSFWGFIWISILTAVLVFLWTLALIIPGIIFSVYYSLSIYVFVFEGKTGMAAVKRSHQLIKGYWWAFLGRIILFSLLVIIIYIIASIIFGLPILVTPANSLSRSMANGTTDVITSIFNAFVIAPLYMIFIGLIYKDLVRIKDQNSSLENPPIAK